MIFQYLGELIEEREKKDAIMTILYDDDITERQQSLWMNLKKQFWIKAFFFS